MRITIDIDDEIYDQIVELAANKTIKLGMKITPSMIMQSAFKNYIEENSAVGRTIVYKAE